jgi:hypothetical protein
VPIPVTQGMKSATRILQAMGQFRANYNYDSWAGYLVNKRAVLRTLLGAKNAGERCCTRCTRLRCNICDRTIPFVERTHRRRSLQSSTAATAITRGPAWRAWTARWWPPSLTPPASLAPGCVTHLPSCACLFPMCAACVSHSPSPSSPPCLALPALPLPRPCPLPPSPSSLPRPCSLRLISATSPKISWLLAFCRAARSSACATRRPGTR